jgi:hypothetical protein
MIFETLHAHIPLELLDRDLACEAVIGAVEADQLGDDPFEQRGLFQGNRLRGVRVAFT